MSKILGLQRDNKFYLRFVAGRRSALPDILTATITYIDGNFEDVNLARFDGMQGEFDRLSERLGPRTSKLLARHSERLDWVLPIDMQSRAVRSIAIRDAVNEVVPWLAQTVSAELRIPASPEEFRAYFTFKKGRPLDVESVMHAAADIVRYRHTSIFSDEKILTYICNSFVILVYKTIETKSNAYQNLIESSAEDVIGLADTVPTGPSVREDSFQARVSILTALCHYSIYTLNINSFVKFSESIRKLDNATATYKITYCYNVCCMLLLLGLHYASRGRNSDAIQVFLNVVEAFRRSSARPTEHLTWFSELAVSHEAGKLALEAIAVLRKKEVLNIDLSRRICERGSRITNEHFVECTQHLLSCGNN